MENVKLFLSQKSQFDPLEKIKNKNKNRTRASLFQSSEDGKQEFFMWPKQCVWKLRLDTVAPYFTMSLSRIGLTAQ